MTTELNSWQIGDVKITRWTEYQGQLRPGFLIANIDEDRLEEYANWMKPHFMKDDGQIRISFYIFIIESAGKRIVLDTGWGNDRIIPFGIGLLQTNFLNDLETVVPRDSIDYVMFTHLHIDHIGWNVMRVNDVWIPTFPKSKYLFPKNEYDELISQDLMDEDDLLLWGLKPIVDANLYELIDHNASITEEVSLEPTPGHSTGHVSVKIESKGTRAIIIGDMFHHPLQIAQPTWGSHVDRKPELAVSTRREFLAKYGDTDVLIIGSHFPGVGAGHLRKKDDSYWLDCG